jgi:hypothetical protein
MRLQRRAPRGRARPRQARAAVGSLPKPGGAGRAVTPNGKPPPLAVRLDQASAVPSCTVRTRVEPSRRSTVLTLTPDPSPRGRGEKIRLAGGSPSPAGRGG